MGTVFAFIIIVLLMLILIGMIVIIGIVFFLRGKVKKFKKAMHIDPDDTGGSRHKSSSSSNYKSNTSTSSSPTKTRFSRRMKANMLTSKN